VSPRERILVVLTAGAVAGVGAVGVWMGLAATSVPTVDLGRTVSDTVTVSTGTQSARLETEWRLHRDGTVSVRVDLGSYAVLEPDPQPLAEAADVAVQLACDARIRVDDLPVGVELVEDGEEAECEDPTGEGVGARQVFLFDLSIDAPSATLTGHPVREWSSSLAGQRTARSPRMILVTGALVDTAIPGGVTTPAARSTLTSVIEAGPNDLIDVTVTPAGAVTESTSVTVQGEDEKEWVDSVSWQLEFEHLGAQDWLDEGLARWTDPAGQTGMQLLLLVSGALVGVAASVAVEWLFSWLTRLRGTAGA